MQSVNCPNCGAEVVFRSPALPSRVCGYCNSVVTRIEEGVKLAGEVAVLPFDVSPIQLGTSGAFNGHGFEVIGRVRLGYDKGSWNDWLCLFNDMSHGWLSESDGQFQLVREQGLDSIHDPLIAHIAGGGDTAPGERAEIDGIMFTVNDVRDAVCISAEGELPFAATTGWRVRNVDLRGPGGEAANVEREEGEPAGFYLGRYVTLDELNPRNLRPIQGWAMPRYAA